MGFLRDWVVKRGVLYALTQMPMIAVLVGYFYRWTDYATATAYTLLPTFILLPVYIVWRRRVSDDPEEPAHHFGRYALWALVPYVVYNLSRIPSHYLLNLVFWDRWYDYGSKLTGKPVNQWSSLLPGTLIHSLQGYVLALGFYVLFKRVTLRNALAYVWVFLSLVYTWHFPRYVFVDFTPPPKWYFLAWWAHFWMAIAAYYTPKLYGPAMRRSLKTPLLTGIVLLLAVVAYVAPIGFVFWRVPNWQFPNQHTIDQTVFNRTHVTLQGTPVLESIETSPPPIARYRFTLRFAPRPYKNYIKAIKAVDAGPVQVTATLAHDGEAVAFCSKYVEKLETPNNIQSPKAYFPALTRMQATDIPVTCLGPGSTARAIGTGRVDLSWKAEVTLVGDREQLQRTYAGSSQGLPLASGNKAGSAAEPAGPPIRPAPHTTTSELIIMIVGAAVMLGMIVVLLPSLNKSTT